MEDNLVFLQNLGLALLLGGIIGLERERNHKDKDLKHEFGGLRTMSLAGMLGYIVFILFGGDTILFSVFSAGFMLLIMTAYRLSSDLDKKTGATTELAAYFVYIIGVLVGMEQVLPAAVITLAVVMLLYFKERLHNFAHKVEREELYDTIKFVAIAFVVLPLLPNEVMGPMNVLNPYVIWLVVVLISSISFLSYVAIKWLGPRHGVGLGGFLGGLISSTAVSMSFSQMSKKSGKLVNVFSFGIVIAAAAMFFRVLIEVSILNQKLLSYLYLPLVAMGGTGLIFSAIFWFQSRGKSVKKLTCKDLNLKSPFQMWPAIQFGLLFAALLFISKFVGEYFGDKGIYLTAALTGLVDVDAITVSMANLSAQGAISTEAGAIAVSLAAMINTLVKGGIVVFFGSKKVGARVLLTAITMVIVGLTVLFFNTPDIYGVITF